MPPAACAPQRGAAGRTTPAPLLLLLLPLVLLLLAPGGAQANASEGDSTAVVIGTSDATYYPFTNSSSWGWNGSCPAVVPTAPIPHSGNAALEAVFGEWLGAWAGFLFITIAASQCALLVRYLALPLITGYMFFGVLVGPEILEMVSKTDIGHLQPITQFALAFISMSAGAELYLPELRALFRRIVTITMAVTVICFFVCLFVIFGLAKGGLIPFMEDLSGACQISIALIGASIMVTQSPASTIAVVAETKSKGPFTSTMLGITVLTDIVVLLLYSICAAIANANCAKEADGFHVLDLFVTVGCIIAAGIIGYVFGKLIIFLLWVPHLHGEWAVLPLGYGVFAISHWFTEFSTTEYGTGINFDALLICIVAGYIVANQSRNRRKFLRFMGSVGPIIFIPFFTLTGAGLDLHVMGQSAGFAIIVFSVRALTFAAGAGGGGHYTGMDKLQNQTLWISMLTQAGVSLGIAAETAIAFPEWGKQFQSTMVSVILINQVVGPVLCKWALKKNGEVGMGGGEEEDEDEEHHKRALIVGINISSLAVAQRLLKHDWNVLFVDTDSRKTDMLQWLKYEKRKKPERSAAEIKKRRAMQAARAAKEASKFVDLAPPGSEAARAPLSMGSPLSSPEPSVNSSLVPQDSDENPFDQPQGGEYGVVGQHHVQVEDRPPSPSMAPASAPAAGVGEDDLTNTTTPPSDMQVQFLLLDPLDASEFDPKDPLSSHPFARESLGLRALIKEQGLTAKNVNAALVMLESDELNFDLCTVLQESMQLPRVIAEIQNPQWTSMFASVGILTVFPYSLASHTFAQLVLTHEHQPLELVPSSRALHVSLSHVIRPDTQWENPPLYLRHLSAEEQAAFLQQHPDPPMPRESMWKFDEKLKVVSAAAREEYLSQIHSLHSNNSIRLDHGKAAAASGMTFSGPGMRMGGGGDEDEDEEERKESQERKRGQREAARARRANEDDAL